METSFFKDYYKTISVLLIIGLILITIFFIPKKDVNQDLIEKLKKEKQEIINKSYNQIDSLKRLNELQEETIAKANFKIDSLNHLKTKVEIVYQNKLKEINGYDSKQVEQYWQGQFN
jgi:hypothetical protein